MRIRVDYLCFIDGVMYLTEVTEERIYCGSQFEGAVYHGGDVMTEGA